jgi:hypothetical protein
VLSPLITTRGAQRIGLTALLLAATLLLALSSPNRAHAKSVWCAGDPAIIVNGSLVSITAHVPQDRVRDIKQVEFVFHVPSNAHVDAILDDSLLFRANITVQKDLPPAYGLVSTPINVEMTVEHRGKSFPIAASTIAVGGGTNLWVDGRSSETLHIQTIGLLNLPTELLALPTVDLSLTRLLNPPLF